MNARVEATEAAVELIEKLKEKHGPLLFHQSGGCCDGSSPMCYPVGDFKVGEKDVYLGEIAGCEFYIGGRQWETWKHTRLLIDAVPGRGGGFSLEAPEGMRFLTRSDVCSPEELQQLGDPDRGPRDDGMPTDP